MKLKIKDTPRPTMSDEEMIKGYHHLAKEYALLHQDYREGAILLRDLLELQNGSPLVKYEKEWNTTMDSCWDYIIRTQNKIINGK